MTGCFELHAVLVVAEEVLQARCAEECLSSALDHGASLSERRPLQALPASAATAVTGLKNKACDTRRRLDRVAEGVPGQSPGHLEVRRGVGAVAHDWKSAMH
jgi:hypothetical protein